MAGVERCRGGGFIFSHLGYMVGNRRSKKEERIQRDTIKNRTESIEKIMVFSNAGSKGDAGERSSEGEKALGVKDTEEI